MLKQIGVLSPPKEVHVSSTESTKRWRRLRFSAFFAVLLSGAIIFGSRHFANPLNSIDSFGLPIGFLVTAALPLILMLIFTLHARRCTRLDRRQQLAEDG